MKRVTARLQISAKLGTAPNEIEPLPRVTTPCIRFAVKGAQLSATTAWLGVTLTAKAYPREIGSAVVTLPVDRPRRALCQPRRPTPPTTRPLVSQTGDKFGPPRPKCQASKGRPSHTTSLVILVSQRCVTALCICSWSCAVGTARRERPIG